MKYQYFVKVFGAYCSVDWAKRKDLKQLEYFGTGESFVFTVLPDTARYEWVGLAQMGDKPAATVYMFQSASDQLLQVGGG